MNLYKEFGKKLKQLVLKKSTKDEIGKFAYSFYWEHQGEIDLRFRDILLTLNTMEDGPEFAFNYAELEQIANDMIAGKKITLS